MTLMVDNQKSDERTEHNERWRKIRMDFIHDCQLDEFSCRQITEENDLYLICTEDNSWDGFSVRCKVKFCPFCGYCTEKNNTHSLPI